MIRTLCALLFLLLAPAASVADDAKALTTILIVARSELPDPNFKDSTVLVMNNVGPVPLGIILNRPTRIAVSHLFPENERLSALQDKVYFGGPVDMTSVSFLYRSDEQDGHAIRVLDGVYFSANRELLDKLLAREKPMEGLRIFVGRSGWGPGQLEGEIARRDWTLAPATADSIFGAQTEHPWPEREVSGTGQRI